LAKEKGYSLEESDDEFEVTKLTGKIIDVSDEDEVGSEIDEVPDLNVKEMGKKGKKGKKGLLGSASKKNENQHSSTHSLNSSASKEPKELKASPSKLSVGKNLVSN
jgi:hypothetical protein